MKIIRWCLPVLSKSKNLKSLCWKHIFGAVWIKSRGTKRDHCWRTHQVWWTIWAPINNDHGYEGDAGLYWRWSQCWFHTSHCSLPTFHPAYDCLEGFTINGTFIMHQRRCRWNKLSTSYSLCALSKDIAMDTKECKDKVCFAVTGKINITFSCEVTETWHYSLVGESTSAEKMLSKSSKVLKAG